ncbi:MAG: signal peptidase II [Polyangiaceae bacterium]|nr:signal peptidase II [Polyangiaceae bacterium]
MRHWSTLAAVLLCLGVVGCDHTTKQLAVTHLSGQGPVPVVPGVLDLRYAENTDTAFSLLGSHVGTEPRVLLLSLLGALVTLGLLGYAALRWRAFNLGERVAMGLLLAGAVGNLGERMVRGHVVDFLHVRHWPVFNVADIAVVAGALLFAFAARRRARYSAV